MPCGWIRPVHRGTVLDAESAMYHIQYFSILSRSRADSACAASTTQPIECPESKRHRVLLSRCVSDVLLKVACSSSKSQSRNQCSRIQLDEAMCERGQWEMLHRFVSGFGWRRGCRRMAGESGVLPHIRIESTFEAGGRMKGFSFAHESFLFDFCFYLL